MDDRDWRRFDRVLPAALDEPAGMAAVRADHEDTLAGRQYQAFADIAQMTFGEQA